MTQNNPLSRRALLAISAAAVAGTASCSTSAAFAQAVTPSPDAALIDLCSQWEALRQEYLRLSSRHYHIFKAMEAGQWSDGCCSSGTP